MANMDACFGPDSPAGGVVESAARPRETDLFHVNGTEALVISAKIKRRHLSVGQMSAIVVELSEKIELEWGSIANA
jgi:hypothetical protein